MRKCNEQNHIFVIYSHYFFKLMNELIYEQSISRTAHPLLKIDFYLCKINISINYENNYY